MAAGGTAVLEYHFEYDTYASNLLNLVRYSAYTSIPGRSIPGTVLIFRILIPGTRIKAVLSDDEGMGQKAYRNPACIMPGCTGEDH